MGGTRVQSTRTPRFPTTRAGLEGVECPVKIRLHSSLVRRRILKSILKGYAMNRFQLPIPLLFTLAVVGCTTITEELPAPPPNPASAPVIVVPAPPPGTATPPPAPAPGAPNPTPTNPPTTQSCPLPAGTWNENCSMQSPTF